MAILPATDTQGALQAAEKLRQMVAGTTFDFENVKIPVTISLGIAQADVGEETAAELIARADEALYHSKDTGRNRASLHDGKACVDTFQH